MDIDASLDTTPLDVAQEKADKLLSTLREIQEVIRSLGATRLMAESIAEELSQMMAEAQKLYEKE